MNDEFDEGQEQERKLTNRLTTGRSRSWNATRHSAEQQAVKLEAERVALADRNVQIQTELDGLKQNQRDHIAAVASTQETQ